MKALVPMHTPRSKHGLCPALWAIFAALGCGTLVTEVVSQEIRYYNVQFTNTAPTIDGTVSPGEWDGADAAAGDWRELRQAFSDVDTDNNRFRILYDSDNLYILYQSDYNNWFNVGNTGNPDINFGDENLNLYIDPNQDGDLNTNGEGQPLTPGVNDTTNVDGYQLAFNQYDGVHVSTDTDRQGIGFFTEAHANTPFGDQANWNEGGSAIGGGALTGSSIVVAQNNSASGGIAEIIIPFADLDADATIISGDPPAADYNDDGMVNAGDYPNWRNTLGDTVEPGTGADGDMDGAVTQGDRDLWVEQFNTSSVAPTGLNATGGVQAGDVWGFNMSMITINQDNFLPIWNWHDAQSFAHWPHGTLTFQAAAGAAGASIPEPSAISLLALGLSGILFTRRQR